MEDELKESDIVSKVIISEPISKITIRHYYRKCYLGSSIIQGFNIYSPYGYDFNIYDNNSLVIHKTSDLIPKEDIVSKGGLDYMKEKIPDFIQTALKKLCMRYNPPLQRKKKNERFTS